MKKILVLSLVLGMVLMASYVYAEELQGIKIGQATLHPSITVEERYDSNIFLDPNNRKEDWINYVTPAFKLDMPFGDGDRHLADVMYKADIQSYAEYDQENHIDQYVNGGVKLNMADKGYLKVRDDFRITRDRSDTEFTQMIKRTENTGEVSAGIDMDKFAYEVGYSNFFRNYADIEYTNLEYNENDGKFTAFYQLFPKTKLLAEYKYGKIDYVSQEASDRDGDYHQGMIGLKGDLTGKTVGIVKAGYQSRTYKGTSEEDFKKPVAEVGLITDFTEKTRLETKFSRMAYESTYENNNYYDSYRLQAKLTQKLWSSWSLYGLLQYENNKYPETDSSIDKRRKDDIYTGNVGLQYDIKDWLKAKFNYEFKEDSSNVDTREYKRHLTSLSLTLLM